MSALQEKKEIERVFSPSDLQHMTLAKKEYFKPRFETEKIGDRRVGFFVQRFKNDVFIADKDFVLPAEKNHAGSFEETQIKKGDLVKVFYGDKHNLTLYVIN